MRSGALEKAESGRLRFKHTDIVSGVNFDDCLTGSVGDYDDKINLRSRCGWETQPVV
jgi:hypothetical protein